MEDNDEAQEIHQLQSESQDFEKADEADRTMDSQSKETFIDHSDVETGISDSQSGDEWIDENQFDGDEGTDDSQSDGDESIDESQSVDDDQMNDSLSVGDDRLDDSQFVGDDDGMDDGQFVGDYGMGNNHSVGGHDDSQSGAGDGMEEVGDTNEDIGGIQAREGGGGGDRLDDSQSVGDDRLDDSQSVGDDDGMDDGQFVGDYGMGNNHSVGGHDDSQSGAGDGMEEVGDTNEDIGGIQAREGGGGGGGAHYTAGNVEDSNVLYPGSEITQEQCTALFMTYIIKHNVSGVQLRDLLSLLNVIVPGCLPQSKYFIDKMFFTNSGVKAQFFCRDCKALLGNDPPDTCANCDYRFSKTESLKNGYYFMTTSVRDQLKDLFENHNLSDNLMENRFEEKEYISDFCDGKFYQENRVILEDSLTFTFNTDGVPVFQSSTFSIWPLFLMINEVVPEKRSSFILLHSLWFGCQKPVMSSFLMPFITDMNDLSHNGITWTDNTGEEHSTKWFVLLAVVDSVARAPLQGIKQFNGEYGCSFCHHPGQVVAKGLGTTRVFPLKVPLPEKRTQQNMRQNAEESVNTEVPVNGVKEVSPLFLLAHYDIARGFSPDYMHSVLLGVVRQTVNMFFNSSSHQKPFFIGKSIEKADKYMEAMSPPSEIQRIPRAVSQRAYWKASEWRAFLLYYSPILFEILLPKKYFLHWLLLFEAIHRLISRHITAQDITIARLCLCKFVLQFEELYGLENVSFNVHLLTHLCDNVQDFGPLWATSAFVFEDANQHLLAMSHGTRGIHVQMVKRFLGYRKITAGARVQMANASEHVAEVYMKLSESSAHIKTASRSNNFVGLGSPHMTSLSLSECEALEEKESKDVTNRHVSVYNRAVCKKFIVTTNTHSAKYRKNDSTIIVNGLPYVIQKLILGKFFCRCPDSNVCSCVIMSYVLCTAHEEIHAPAYHDSYANVNLHNKWLKVRNTGVIYAFSPSEIESKAVFLTRNEDEKCFPINQV